ncbi:MAG: nucleotide exchange factor GrpE [Alphaproteobacteria bacterium]|nr:nucleotide exchange factor GrpE [Alphaproteobacteria bacterium]
MTEQEIQQVKVSKAVGDTFVDTKDEQIAELQDKYIRAMAELENTKRRSTVDVQAAAARRGIMVAEKFLPLIDAIHAALSHAPDDEGIKTLYAASESVLAGIGIIKIDTVGQKLNPLFHHAISASPSEGTEPDIILEEFQAGYMMGDNVLRPAMVVVSK